MRISTHVTKMYLGVAVSLLTGCSGCGDEVEKNPAPESVDNGAESVNCECQVTPTGAGRAAGFQPVSINIDACLPVANHDDPEAYCQGSVAPWLRAAVEQTAISSQDPSFLSPCDATELVCGTNCTALPILPSDDTERLFNAASCEATAFPDDNITHANAECEGTCEQVLCDKSCIPGGLAQCACTVVNGCGGPIGCRVHCANGRQQLRRALAGAQPHEPDAIVRRAPEARQVEPRPVEARRQCDDQRLCRSAPHYRVRRRQ